MHNTLTQAALNRVLDELHRQEVERPAIRKAGLEALERLVNVALRNSGQSGIVARFLLSLYNGAAYPFALTDLRGLDHALYQDCIAVLHLDNTPEQEVHTYIDHGEVIWESFKNIWRNWRNQYN